MSVYKVQNELSPLSMAGEITFHDFSMNPPEVCDYQIDFFFVVVKNINKTIDIALQKKKFLPN